MRISELLYSIASWLESPNNEAILLSEYDENCLNVVASGCVEAANTLKKVAEEVEAIEPPEQSNITPQSIQELADIATAFDLSGDERLKKQASVIDELLLTIAAPNGAFAEKLAAQDRRLEDLRAKYQENQKKLNEVNKVADVIKDVEKSEMTESKQLNVQPLSTRYCPDHHGTMMFRESDHEFRCPLNNKTYNYREGFTLENGTKVPGGAVEEQNAHLVPETYTIFDTRQQRLETNKA